MKLPRKFSLDVCAQIVQDFLSSLGLASGGRVAAPRGLADNRSVKPRRSSPRNRRRTTRAGRPLYQSPGIESLEPRQSASVISSFDAVTGTLYLTDSTVGSISINSYAAPYASTVQKIVIQVQTGMGENDISLDINGNLYPRLREIDVIDSAGNDGYGSGYGGGYGGSYGGGYGGVLDEIKLFANVSSSLFSASANGVVSFTGGDGIDIFYAAAGGGLSALHGGTGTETLYGSTGTNALYDGGGSNTLRGGTGDNTIFATSGSNALYAGSGNNTILGGAGTDILYGSGGGSNTLHAGAGHETLYGGHGTNVLFGATANSLLVDGGGQNTVYNIGTLSSASGISMTGTSSSYSIVNHATGPITLTASATSGGLSLISANNTFSGTYAPLTIGSAAHLSLVKTGDGTLALSGSNVYDGATTVTAGTLALNSNATLGNTAIAVNASGALAVYPATTGTVTAGTTGAGSAGASLAFNSGSAFDMTDGALGTFQLRHQDSFAGPSLAINNARLSFDLSSGGADALIAGGSATVAGINTIDIKTFGTSLSPNHSYNLITASGGLTGFFMFADGSNTEAITVGDQSYTLTLGNTSTAETLNVATTDPTAGPVIGPLDFVWPAAPNDNALVIPADSDQPQPPAAPTYNGVAFDYTQDAGYLAAVALAEQHLTGDTQSAETGANGYQAAVQTADNVRQASKHTADLTYDREFREAHDRYDTSRQNSPQFDTNRLTKLQHDIDSAWSNYRTTVDQNNQHYSETVTGAETTRNHDNGQTSQDEQAADDAAWKTDHPDDDESNQDPDQAAEEDAAEDNQFETDEHNIDKDYAPKYQKIDDDYWSAVYDAQKQRDIANADALKSAWKSVYEADRDIASLIGQFDHTAFASLLTDEQALVSGFAAATEHRAESYAEADCQYAKDVADAAQTRDQQLADAQQRHDKDISQAKAVSFTTWAAGVNASGATEYEKAWANYQAQLAANENNYQRAVADLAHDRDNAKADSTWHETRAIANAKETQTAHDVQADEGRTSGLSDSMRDFEIAVDETYINRDVGSSGGAGAVESLAAAWCDRQVAYAGAEDTYSRATATIDASYSLLDKKAQDAFDAAMHRYDDVWFHDGHGNWWLNVDDSQARDDATLARDRALKSDSLNSSLATEDADQDRVDSEIGADQEFRHKSADAFRVASSDVTVRYATFEIDLARAQDLYNATTATDARDYLVAEAKAQAGQSFRNAEADATYERGSSSPGDKGEAGLSNQHNIADAQAKQSFEIGEATLYQSAVGAWAATEPARWGQYQLDLATHELARITTVDAAEVTKANNLASIGFDQTRTTVSADIVYATAMYGSEEGGGAYVARAQSIADAYLAAATGDGSGPGPLETFATDEAESVSTHDQQVANSNEELFGGIADADATYARAVNQADHALNRADDQNWFDYTKPEADNPISWDEYNRRNEAASQAHTAAVAHANKDRTDKVADLEDAWVHEVGGLNTTLADDWTGAQVARSRGGFGRD